MAGDKDKISKLRRGIPPHKIITLGNDSESVRVAVVLLSADVMQMVEEDTEEYCQENQKRVNAKVRNKYHNKVLCFYCMRDPSDPTYERFMADDIDDVGRNLDDEDIKRVCEAYSELLINKAPKLELLKAEEFEELKKHLEVTQLSDLSTVSLAHLTHFHRTIVSEK